METFYLGNRIENLLLKVLRDMEPYKDNAILIGGWLPYIYHNYLWKSNKQPEIISTKDIDFALREDFHFKGQVLEAMFMRKEYYKKESVSDVEDLPLCFAIKEGEDEMRIDFLSHEYMDPMLVGRLTGGNIEVAPVGYIEYLLKKENTEIIRINAPEGAIDVRIPLPAAYLFVKGLSCGEREIKERGYKFKKDLWSIYFVIDNIPEEQKNSLIEQIRAFRVDKNTFCYFINNLKEYFESVESDGPCAVAELLNLPQDIIKKRTYELVRSLLKDIEE